MKTYHKKLSYILLGWCPRFREPRQSTVRRQSLDQRTILVCSAAFISIVLVAQTLGYIQTVAAPPSQSAKAENLPSRAVFDDSLILTGDGKGPYSHNITKNQRISGGTMTGLFVMLDWRYQGSYNIFFRIDTYTYGSDRQVYVSFDDPRTMWLDSDGKERDPPIHDLFYGIDMRVWPVNYSGSCRKMTIGKTYECESWVWLYTSSGRSSLSHYEDQRGRSYLHDQPNDLNVTRISENLWRIDSSAYFEYYRDYTTEAFCQLSFQIYVSEL